jgi:hypothetical protein
MAMELVGVLSAPGIPEIKEQFANFEVFPRFCHWPLLPS